MKFNERLFILVKLGKVVIEFIDSEEISNLYSKIKNQNGWFTNDNVKLSLENICKHFLDEEKLNLFCQNYNIDNSKPQKTIGIVASGNIPAVAFHDLLCVFISGNIANVKLSSTDSALMLFLINKMYEINTDVKEYIKISDRLNGVDAIIATGSNNTAKYFEYYFSKIPNIIRKNRTSIAVLDGSETKIELANLGTDIFTYFGLGCRNVSKIFVPKGFDFVTFFESIEYWNTINLHHKYNNNYDYNKSIYLINGDKHFDNGFLLVKEDSENISPLGVLFYEEYDKISDVVSTIETKKEQIQCVVSKIKLEINSVNFGETQSPSLLNFADDVDTMKFLTAL